MKVVREVGTVESVGEGKVVAVVREQKGGACARCGACSFGSDGVGRMEVECEEEVKAGDEVVIELGIPSAYAGILFLFVLPLVGLVAGGLMGEALGGAFGAVGKVESLLPVVLGVVGFGGGLFGGYVVERRLKGRMPEPRVVEVRRSEEG